MNKSSKAKDKECLECKSYEKMLKQLGIFIQGKNEGGKQSNVLWVFNPTISPCPLPNQTEADHLLYR